jgi:hypothetical protein
VLTFYYSFVYLQCLLVVVVSSVAVLFLFLVQGLRALTFYYCFVYFFSAFLLVVPAMTVIVLVLVRVKPIFK